MFASYLKCTTAAQSHRRTLQAVAMQDPDITTSSVHSVVRLAPSHEQHRPEAGRDEYQGTDRHRKDAAGTGLGQITVVRHGRDAGCRGGRRRLRRHRCGRGGLRRHGRRGRRRRALLHHHLLLLAQAVGVRHLQPVVACRDPFEHHLVAFTSGDGQRLYRQTAELDVVLGRVAVRVGDRHGHLAILLAGRDTRLDLEVDIGLHRLAGRQVLVDVVRVGALAEVVQEPRFGWVVRAEQLGGDLLLEGRFVPLRVDVVLAAARESLDRVRTRLLHRDHLGETRVDLRPQAWRLLELPGGGQRVERVAERLVALDGDRPGQAVARMRDNLLGVTVRDTPRDGLVVG